MKIKKIAYILFIFFITVESSFSQNIKQLTPAETLKEISLNVNKGNFDNAVHLMYSYVAQTETSNSERVIKITQDISSQIYPDVHTYQLDELGAQICASLSTEHPDYGILGSRIEVSNIHKNTLGDLEHTITKLYKNKDIKREKQIDC